MGSNKNIFLFARKEVMHSRCNLYLFSHAVAHSIREPGDINFNKKKQLHAVCVGRGNLVLRHPVPHFLLISRGIAC